MPRRKELSLGCSKRGERTACDAENNVLIKSDCKNSSMRGELKVPPVPNSLLHISPMGHEAQKEIWSLFLLTGMEVA